MLSDVCSLSLVLPALCCFWLKEGACDFADCAHQPVSGTENTRPRHCFHSCCIMNVLMSLSRLESPAGMQPDAPHIFATTPTSAQRCSAKFSFKVLPGIYFMPEKQVQQSSGAQACSDFSFLVDITVMLPNKSDFPVKPLTKDPHMWPIILLNITMLMLEHPS